MNIDEWNKYQAARGKRKRRRRKRGPKILDPDRELKQYGPMPNDPPIIQSHIKWKDNPAGRAAKKAAEDEMDKPKKGNK